VSPLVYLALPLAGVLAGLVTRRVVRPEIGSAAAPAGVPVQTAARKLAAMLRRDGHAAAWEYLNAGEVAVSCTRCGGRLVITASGPAGVQAVGDECLAGACGEG
jgi:hypothetical protein